MIDFLLSESRISTAAFTSLGTIAVLGFLLFVISGITANFHEGNIAGCIFSAMLLIFVLKRVQAAKLITRLMQLQWGRAVLAAAAAVIICSVIAAIVISVLMIMKMNRMPEKPAPVIVLGCRVKESGPSLMLEKRIAAAYEYLSENESVMCIASGGKGSDEPVSEAECIKSRLVEMGIDEDRIILEDKSSNTAQNLRYSAMKLEEYGLGSSAVIVTSEFHQLRAGMIASKCGIKAYSKSSATFPPLLAGYWIREWFGVLHELIIGRK